MERKKFLKLSMLLVVMVMMVFVQPRKVQATADATIDTNQTGSLTITKKAGDTTTPLSGVEYTLYKIADITQVNNNGKVQLNYTIITDVFTEEFTEDVSIPSAGDVETMTEMHTQAELLVSKLNATAKNNAITSSATNQEGKTTFSGLGVGVYLVHESKLPAGATVGQSFIITIPMTASTGEDAGKTWVYNISATPKNVINGVTKNILVSDNTAGPSEDDQLEKKKSYEIGDTITYRIEADVPTNVGDLKYYYIEDVPSSGLTVKSDSVVVYGENSDGNVTEITNDESTTYYTVSDGKIYFATNEIANYTKIYVDIQATLNENAVIGTTGNANEAKIWYSSTASNGSNTPEIPSESDGLDSVEQTDGDETIVYTYGINLDKQFESPESGPDKSGVKFELFEADGTTPINVASTTANGTTYYYLNESKSSNIVTTDADGKIRINGLKEGKYVLKEIETKSGYTLLKEPIEIVINETLTRIPITVTAKINGGDTITPENTGYFNFTVLNKKGFTLPSTGGRGIYIFTITGLLIMAGAVVLMVKNKKKSK